MRKILAVATLAVAVLSGTAQAQMILNSQTLETLGPLDQLRAELAIGPLGLERAIEINGMKCTMTTPYDKWAKCGMDRVTIIPCPFPAFKDGKLVCYELAPPKK